MLEKRLKESSPLLSLLGMNKSPMDYVKAVLSFGFKVGVEQEQEGPGEVWRNEEGVIYDSNIFSNGLSSYLSQEMSSSLAPSATSSRSA